MKKLLVPTDFSAEAASALKVAAYIAKKTGAEIILFNVIEMALPVDYYRAPVGDLATLPIPTDNTVQMKALKEMKQKLKAIEHQLSEQEIKCKSEVDVDVDNVFKDISEVIAKREDVDLIIMGSKGASGLSEVLIGSNTERVVRYAKTPVLTVKSMEDNFKISQIVYSTDFEETSPVIVKKAKEIAALFRAHLCLLYVNTPNYFISNQDINLKFEKLVKEYHITNYSTHIYNDFNEEKGILNFTKEIGGDLIIMPTNGRTGLSHLINGSITENIVNHTSVPVLSLNMGKISK
ncbi:MAG: hypothetical protein RIQ70_306 [Bacteroidota bacterium]|jgi:nucleotide-binding universal stress UspA family protein